jgi:uncharacterized protein
MITQLDPSTYLIVNQFTGAVTLADVAWWDALELTHAFSGPKVEVREVDPETLLAQGKVTKSELDELVSLGYLLTAETRTRHEQRIVEFSELKIRTRPHTFFITPHLTCPLGCVYCFENQARNPESRRVRLTVEDLDSIERFIQGRCEEKGLMPHQVTIVLFGGEPLMPVLREFNQRLVELAHRRNYFWRINTSGVSLDEDYLNLISKYRETLQEVDITIDGPMDTHNRLRPLANGSESYSLVKRNVDRLLARGIRVMVKTNVGKDTIANLARFISEMTAYGWFDHPFFLYATNVVRAFGGTEAAGQAVDEDGLAVRLVEIFRSPTLAPLLSKVRLEGLRVTEYLANAFHLLSERSADGDSTDKFDAYPKHAFCHPNDGTAMNISYDGSIYTCNWMAGRRQFSVGSIFENGGAIEKEKLASHQLPTVRRHNCRDCSLSTICGGGCLIDRAELRGFGAMCYDYTFGVANRFIAKCVNRKWIDTELRGRKLVTLRDGFDLAYRYESRTER